MLPNICPFSRKLRLTAKSVLFSMPLKVKRGSFFFISFLTTTVFIYGHTRAFPPGFRRLKLSYQAVTHSPRKPSTLCISLTLDSASCRLLCSRPKAKTRLWTIKMFEIQKKIDNLLSHVKLNKMSKITRPSDQKNLSEKC
jgi:hypothetical protein